MANQLFFSVDHIRSITPCKAGGTYNSLITVGDTEDNMFFVDQSCLEVADLLLEGVSL